VSEPTTKRATVLVADDEDDLRTNLGRFLEQRGFAVALAADGTQALAELRTGRFDAALLDIRMHGKTGIEILEALSAEGSPVRIVIMTAFATVESAVSALRAGAADYVLKPFDLATIATKLAVLTEAPPPGLGDRFPTLVAESEVMKRVLHLAAQLAPTPATILLTGESGVGKEVIARAIHDASPRAAEPCVVVNCGALPEALVESELFGHERGAFTGALGTKRGLFEVAEHGTLLLDEVGELPPAAQVKLLRAIERKEVRRVGATEARTVDVRIMAATNRKLRELVKAGLFREDLYYRLAVFEIVVPPLRARRADILRLATHFLGRHAVELGRRLLGFSPEAARELETYGWPGNVRELENTVARAALLAKDELVAADDLAFPGAEGAGGALEAPLVDDLRQARAAFERAHVRRVLEKYGDDKARAAEALGIDLSSLYRKLGRGQNDAD
jgi:DNA-binding NtrC family response regulator